jgi:hypothetical protein
MKRVIAITVTLVIACAAAAYGQPSSTVSLAEVARQEEARRKSAKKAKPTMVFTNSSLATLDAPESVVSSAPVASSNASPSGVKDPTIPGGKVEDAPPAKGDQAFWQGRISKARTELTRTQMFADSLQTKINSLRTDFTNRDNRVEREKIQQDLNTALAELERLKKEIDTQQKAITAIEDEARRAGVPAGWLRPPA